MRHCEKQVFETWPGKQDGVYQVKHNLFYSLVLFTTKVRFGGWRGFHLVSF